MSHWIIRLIVYAKNESEAKQRAKGLLFDLVGEKNEPFDFGSLFDDEYATSRWGNLPAVSLASSKEGKKLISEGMKYTKESFIENVKKVREMINDYSNEELFEQEVIEPKKKLIEALETNPSNNLMMFKYYCSCLGQYVGGEIYLYDNDGEGIRDNKYLKNVLDKWDEVGEIVDKDLKVYVVPVDVHS